MTTANTNEDKLILGGHEFTSRFIPVSYTHLTLPTT